MGTSTQAIVLNFDTNNSPVTQAFINVPLNNIKKFIVRELSCC